MTNILPTVTEPMTREGLQNFLKVVPPAPRGFHIAWGVHPSQEQFMIFHADDFSIPYVWQVWYAENEYFPEV